VTPRSRGCKGAELPGPFQADRLTARLVGPRVNSARNEGPEYLEPVRPDES
jgi:putative SOS response-associated peptidase YedK